MSETHNPTTEHLQQVSIEHEMRHSYIDYAMSVIVSRALPDVRDGLKPVHRRIMFAMHEMNNYHDKPYKKSARVVGDVIGKYHPHGNDSIYMALVRMAQDFSLRNPLVDGQGNFGSVDGDEPAAMRYTEVRLAKIASTILQDIECDTVNFTDNYDGSEKEPTVLPARFPNLLVNGTSGIAVGMATNIPTHNLGEVIDACLAYINNNAITLQELLDIVPAPDFPTGGIIINPTRAKEALATGRGSVIMRSKVDFEELGGRQAIIIKELPYQVNKAELLRHIEQLCKDKEIEGIHEIRDESNKLGIRAVIELKKDVNGEVLLNQLYKYTQLQCNFPVNMLALHHGRPLLMNLLDIITAFVTFRQEVVTRRLVYLLNKARNRAHILLGLSLAVANIDAVIALIKRSPDPATAKKALMETKWQATNVLPLLKLVDDHRNKILDGEYCHLTEEQATAILEMRLQRLTALEADRLENELQGLAKQIAEYLEILGDKQRIMNIISEELTDIKEAFATPRKTSIEYLQDDVDIEDLIAKEDMVVTSTMSGYIKRVPLATYRAQRRGGKGRSGMSTYDDDATTDILVCNTHNSLLFFSNFGKVYRLKVYKIPLGTPQAKGRALVNLLPLAPEEKITNITIYNDENTDSSIVFATANGNIRRNDIADFARINSNGKIAMQLDDNDKLIGVAICQSSDHILLCTAHGKALRFAIDELRVFKSRASSGVRGIKLAKSDHVVSMAVLQESRIPIEQRDAYLRIPCDARINYQLTQDESLLLTDNISLAECKELAAAEQFILSITEKGYGKRSSAYEYRITGRAGSGVVNIDTSERNGNVVASLPVSEKDEIILLTNAGTLIRTLVSSIRITGRSAMGVKLMNLQDQEKVISVSKIVADDETTINEENHADTTSL